MVKRILASVFLLVSVLFLPLWFSALLALILMFYFDIFWEAVALFLLSDLLYGVPQSGFYNFAFVSFVSAGLGLLLIEFAKKKLKFYV